MMVWILSGLLIIQINSVGCVWFDPFSFFMLWAYAFFVKHYGLVLDHWIFVYVHLWSVLAGLICFWSVLFSFFDWFVVGYAFWFDWFNLLLAGSVLISLIVLLLYH